MEILKSPYFNKKDPHQWARAFGSKLSEDYDPQQVILKIPAEGSKSIDITAQNILDGFEEHIFKIVVNDLDLNPSLTYNMLDFDIDELIPRSHARDIYIDISGNVARYMDRDARQRSEYLSQLNKLIYWTTETVPRNLQAANNIIETDSCEDGPQPS